MIYLKELKKLSIHEISLTQNNI